MSIARSPLLESLRQAVLDANAAVAGAFEGGATEVVVEEIGWALEAKLTFIPIWHNGFSYKSEDWTLPPPIDEALRLRHTIRVLEENPLAYNNAIIELLNRFGGTV